MTGVLRSEWTKLHSLRSSKASLLVAVGLVIGIGVLAWALGNLYYTVVLYDMESPPIPSPADAGFLLFPVLGMIGVLALVRARTHDVPKTLWTDGSIAALAVIDAARTSAAEARVVTLASAEPA